jgi:polyhydroxybutyrate depolymerase
MGSERRLPAQASRLIAAALLIVVAACGDDDSDAQAPPTTADPCAARAPLLIELHGYSENAEGHESVVQWEPFAAEHGFTVITPQAGGEPPHWDLDADVGMIERLIDDAVAEDCADPDRIYLSGYSMGGMLISHAACRLADKLAAVAPVAGLRAVEPCAQSQPVPVVVVHGTDDDTVLYDGGLTPVAADALEMPVDGPSIPTITAAWAERNGCDAEPDGLPAPASDGRVAVHRFSCPDGADVDLHVIDGGNHGWPPSVKERLWTFLSRHARQPV